MDIFLNILLKPPQPFIGLFFMLKVPKYIAIKYMCEIHTKDERNAMSKVSKIHCTDLNALNGMYVGDVGDGVCGFYATLYAEYRFHVEDIEDILYSGYSGPLPHQEGRLVVAVPSILWV